MRSGDRDLQDKNLIGSLDRLATTTELRDSVDSILTYVYPYDCHYLTGTWVLYIRCHILAGWQPPYVCILQQDRAVVI